MLSNTVIPLTRTYSFDTEPETHPPEPQLIACASTAKITKEHVEFEIELLSRSRREIPI